ncbi:hypothetical protein [Engelhardtia mirabilis]|uniref:Uncharacterized protein n=1 Tax=Engelhardtia mirabilis TaxID=2528011 RepID=A0A518BLT3_9BACT|nr:hypothetical protein Pla133_30230 [Planctomycetes bacterium Pla133]QDV02260.1 hypothetical protein Pla86_30220 [Planctomycetes bacterium Pla86]
MQVRIGVCTSCDAKFEIPVSFDQAWAKCLICEGAVRIGEPELSDAAKKAERAAAREADVAKGKQAAPAAAVAAVAGAEAPPRAAAPAPVRVTKAEPVSKPEPVVTFVPDPVAEIEEEAELELEPLEEAVLEAEPLADAPPPSPKMSTLERLKAERAAAAADAAAPAPKPQSTLERIKAQRAAEAAAAERAVAEPTPVAANPNKAASASRGSGRKSAGDDGAGASAGGRKRSGGARRRPAAKKAERSSKPLLIAGGSLIVIGIGVIGITQGWFEGAKVAQAESGEDQVADAPEDKVSQPAVNPFDLVGGTPTPIGNASAASAAAASEGSSTDGGAAAAAPAQPAAPAANPKHDPDTVDLAALPTYDKLPETSDEDWASIVADAEKLVDPAGTRGSTTASQRLIERGVEAMPAIMNAFKTVDLYDNAGLRTGGLVQRTLEEICNGTNYGWQDGLERDQIWFNKRVVVAWNKAWGQAEGNEFARASLLGEEPPSANDAGGDGDAGGGDDESSDG